MVIVKTFAITVADYLTALGHDRRHLALALVNSGWLPVKGGYNHAVLIVSTGRKGQIIVDNMSKSATRVNFYDSGMFHSLRRMDSDQWRKAEISRQVRLPCLQALPRCLSHMLEHHPPRGQRFVGGGCFLSSLLL